MAPSLKNLGTTTAGLALISPIAFEISISSVDGFLLNLWPRNTGDTLLNKNTILNVFWHSWVRKRVVTRSHHRRSQNPLMNCESTYEARMCTATIQHFKVRP